MRPVAKIPTSPLDPGKFLFEIEDFLTKRLYLPSPRFSCPNKPSSRRVAPSSWCAPWSKYSTIVVDEDPAFTNRETGQLINLKIIEVLTDFSNRDFAHGGIPSVLEQEAVTER
jgi:hypothetical protein